ncbi:MAG: MerR family DNA-binding transcriptional regulator [Pseudomonadota bacterium]
MEKSVDAQTATLDSTTATSELATPSPRAARRERDSEFPYRIGDLAREFDVTLRTLRFYEDKRLLRPKRMGTTRLYSERDRERLQLILKGKTVGFPLADIRRLLALYDFDASRFSDPAEAKAMFKAQQVEMLRQRRDVELALVTLSDTIEEFEGAPSALN